MKHYVGIDLGGTNVRVCKVNEQGEITQDLTRPSHGLEGPEAIEKNIIEMLKEFDLSDVLGIGLAIPGPVDGELNVITQATNIPGCEGYKFADHIEEATGVKVFLDNDANAAGLAEAILGAGKGKKIVYYLTHSTGIGGGLIINEKIISGYRGYAGEVANVVVDPNAKRYDCYSHLNVGGVESVASGRALGLFGHDLLGDEVNGGSDVFKLAKAGNERAQELINKMSENFGQLLCDISAIVAPDCFVIGGGVSHSSDQYFHLVINYYKKHAHGCMAEVPILKATLAEPGVLGAAMIARSHCE